MENETSGAGELEMSSSISIAGDSIVRDKVVVYQRSEVILQPLGGGFVGHEVSAASLAWHPVTPNFLVSCSQDATIAWDTANERRDGKRVAGQSDTTLGVGFTRGGGLVRFADDDGVIHMLEVMRDMPFGILLRVDSDNVKTVTMNPDGESLAVLRKDNTVVMVELDGREPIGKPLGAATESPAGMLFSRSGVVVAIQTMDEYVLWNVESQERLGAFRMDGPPSIAQAPVSAQDLVAMSYDEGIVLVDAQTGSAVQFLNSSYVQRASYAALGPKEQTLAVGKKDGSVMLWDLEANRPLVELSLGVPQAVRQLAFDKDGSRLAVLHFGGVITLWNIAVNTWLDLARSIANRNLTREEWEQFVKLGSERYEDYMRNPTFPGLPVQE